VTVLQGAMSTVLRSDSHKAWVLACEWCAAACCNRLFLVVLNAPVSQGVFLAAAVSSLQLFFVAPGPSACGPAARQQLPPPVFTCTITARLLCGKVGRAAAQASTTAG
jgi:hypothetical protein